MGLLPTGVLTDVSEAQLNVGLLQWGEGGHPAPGGQHPGPGHRAGRPDGGVRAARPPRAVQVWLGGWRGTVASTEELTPVWSRVDWVELLLQAGRIDWKEEVAGPHLARGDPLAAMQAVYKELKGRFTN